jgi:hypothetical protein
MKLPAPKPVKFCAKHSTVLQIGNRTPGSSLDISTRSPAILNYVLRGSSGVTQANVGIIPSAGSLPLPSTPSASRRQTLYSLSYRQHRQINTNKKQRSRLQCGPRRAAAIVAGCEQSSATHTQWKAWPTNFLLLAILLSARLTSSQSRDNRLTAPSTHAFTHSLIKVWVQSNPAFPK